jgi:hypothetical protein
VPISETIVDDPIPDVDDRLVNVYFFFFFAPTVRFGPLRVRAFVEVR